MPIRLRDSDFDALSRTPASRELTEATAARPETAAVENERQGGRPERPAVALGHEKEVGSAQALAAAKEKQGKTKWALPETISEEAATLLRASSNFRLIGNLNQKKFIAVMDACLRPEDDPERRRRMEKDLLALLGATTEKEPLLLQRDNCRPPGTLLGHLHILALHERNLLEPALRDKRDILLLSLVRKLKDPKQLRPIVLACLEQNGAGESLAALQPAEFARVVQQLATTGSARLAVISKEDGSLCLSHKLILEFKPPTAEASPEAHGLAAAVFKSAVDAIKAEYKAR